MRLRSAISRFQYWRRSALSAPHPGLQVPHRRVHLKAVHVEDVVGGVDETVVGEDLAELAYLRPEDREVLVLAVKGVILDEDVDHSG